MPADPYRYFRVEARELIDQLGQAVLELESGAAGPDTVARMLRLAHTLKGAARVVKQTELADHTHELEDVLTPYRKSTAPPPTERISRLLALVDEINARIAALPPPPAAPASSPASAGPTAPAAPPAGPPAAAPMAASAAGPAPVPAAAPTPVTAPAPRAVTDIPMPVRADSADVDDLLDAIGEAQAQFAPVRQAIVDLERIRRSLDLLIAQFAAPAGRAGVPDLVRSIVAELDDDLATFGRGLSRTVERTEREIHQVRANAEQLRLVPAGTVFAGLQRSVRDAGETAGKRVSFEGVGGDVRLDPQVLSTVYGALLHAVRNAVAHGVETAAHREAAGKPAEGRVTVAVRRRGTRIAFTCRDDGRGFDLEAMRAAAVGAGMAPVRAAGLAPHELMALALRGGISTSATVTELSGRGVGLDAVRDAAERLGGEVRLDSEPGRGATVELVVPLSLLSAACMVVEVAGTTASIPLDAVRHCLRVQSTDLVHSSSGATVRHRDRAIPFLALAPAFGAGAGDRTATRSAPRPAARHANGPADHLVAVVVTTAAGTVAVGVDRVLGTAPVIVRALPPLAPAGAVVGGVSLDGEGNPRVVLDPDGLVLRGLGGPAAAHGGTGSRGTGSGGTGSGGTALDSVSDGDPAPKCPPLLVIDDSLTTRMLERSILESAGYDVDVAASAEEGLDKARTTRYGLFLVDIEMPGMDGFTFVAQTRADPVLRDVPAILVSSRASPEDRRRGAEAGAVLHVAKHAFNQNELLTHIGKLVG